MNILLLLTGKLKSKYMTVINLNMMLTVMMPVIVIKLDLHPRSSHRYASSMALYWMFDSCVPFSVLANNLTFLRRCSVTFQNTREQTIDEFDTVTNELCMIWWAEYQNFTSKTVKCLLSFQSIAPFYHVTAGVSAGIPLWFLWKRCFSSTTWKSSIANSEHGKFRGPWSNTCYGTSGSCSLASSEE